MSFKDEMDAKVKNMAAAQGLKDARMCWGSLEEFKKHLPDALPVDIWRACSKAISDGRLEFVNATLEQDPKASQRHTKFAASRYFLSEKHDMGERREIFFTVLNKEESLEELTEAALRVNRDINWARGNGAICLNVDEQKSIYTAICERGNELEALNAAGKPEEKQQNSGGGSARSVKGAVLCKMYQMER